MSEHRVVRAVALGAAVGLGAHWASAASILEFDEWMGEIDRRSQEVQRRLERRDAAGAAEEGAALERLYARVEDYFAAAADAEPAVAMAREGRGQARLIVERAKREEYDAAFQSALALARGCGACHDAYKPLR